MGSSRTSRPLVGRQGGAPGAGQEQPQTQDQDQETHPYHEEALRLTEQSGLRQAASRPGARHAQDGVSEDAAGMVNELGCQPGLGLTLDEEASGQATTHAQAVQGAEQAGGKAMRQG